MSKWTKLTEASREDKKVDIKRILSLGADISETISTEDKYDGLTALSIATRYNHKEVVEVLFSHGAD
eukprot:5190913-Ditylum_brightwellii.AAC.1